jgi:hypothetical protein
VPVIKHGAPFAASRLLDALPGRAKVLNNYTLGGWLLWTARDVDPAIDGRTEIYAPSYVAATLAEPGLPRGWKGYLRKNDFDAAWLDKDVPLIFGLKSLGWTVVYRDHFSVILIPPTSK